MVFFKKNKKLLIVLIIIIIFTGLFFRYLNRAPKRNYCDFRVFYATAQRFAACENIYARPDEKITPYKYSPIVAMMFSPLSVLSQKKAALVFFTINFIFLALALIYSRKIITKDDPGSAWGNFGLYALSTVCCLRFILHAFDSGQVGVIITFFVVFGLYFIQKKKEVIGSAFLSLGSLFKYTPFLFLPYFLLRKKIKVVIFVIVFVAVYFLLPALHVGIDNEVTYIKNWVPFITSTSFDHGSWYDNKNQSIYSVFLRYLTKDSPYKVRILNLSFNQGIALSFFVILVLYMLIIVKKQNSDFETCIDYSLLFVSMAFFNPNGWLHNYAACIFPYMALFYYLIKTAFKDKIVLLLVVLSFALTTLTSEMFVGDNLETVFEEFSVTAIGFFVLMLALFKVKFFEVVTHNK